MMRRPLNRAVKISFAVAVIDDTFLPTVRVRSPGDGQITA
jgi:hypothetical protein